jgi:hypothetical protein
VLMTSGKDVASYACWVAGGRTQGLGSFVAQQAAVPTEHLVGGLAPLPAKGGTHFQNETRVPCAARQRQ